VSDGDLVKINLPVTQIYESHESFPTDWGNLTYCEMMTLETIFPETLDASQHIQEKTIGQSDNEIWMRERSKRITSSQAHKITTRKENNL